MSVSFVVFHVHASTFVVNKHLYKRQTMYGCMAAVQSP